MKKLIALLLALLVVFSLSAPSFAANGNLISESRAKEIALNHAGYVESEVRFQKVRLERDDGRYEYEVEFIADDNCEYEYSINAESGRIVEFDRDYEGGGRFEGFSLFSFLRNLFARFFR